MNKGDAVERKFPLYSPIIKEIEVIRRGIVRRAKLYYLRNLSGKAARIKEKKFVKKAVDNKSADKTKANNTAQSKPKIDSKAKSK